MMRWNFALFGVLLACVAGAPPAFAATTEPIRVGYMGPLTGIFAQAGKDMLDGFRLYFEQTGFQAAGRKIELIEEDTEGNPATAISKLRKLVERDRIHVMAGILLSNIGYALSPVVDRERLPSLFLTTPDDLTKRRPAKFMFRLNFAGSQTTHPFGEYAYKTLGYRKVAAIAMDNNFGYEQLGGFQRTFEELGGRVVQKIWAPLNAQDFAPYITQLRRDVDAVFTVFVAAQSIRFVRQYQEYGLKGKLPLIGSGVTFDEHALRSMGDEAIGAIGPLIWAPTLESPANRAFMAAARGKFGRTPAYFHAVMYSGARWIVEGAKLIGGNVEDRERFLNAIRQAASGEDIRGPIRLDEFGNPTENVYILKVEKIGDKLQNMVIHTYPMVSQFWTYKPEDFLKDPPYSRDYPPVRP